MTVLVIGATGTVGPHVVAALTALGTPVRVLARDGDRARTLLPTGVDVRAGDPGDAGDLLSAVDADVTAVFLLTAHAGDMAETQLRVIRALRRAPVRIVKLSGTNSAIHPNGPHACRQHWEVEQVLAAGGQPFAVLRANAFMQTLIDQIMLPAALDAGVVANPIADAGISFIDARDVGACAAAVLTDARYDGKTLTLTGPAAVTYRQIADHITTVTGRPVTVREITPADVRDNLAARGMPEWETEHFEEMYELFRDGGSEFVTDDVARILGRTATTVEQHLFRHPRLAATA
ncbi:MAG TPA: NmrA family NAD(P)-binding protein [Micromonosporaceae bacterium]